MESPSFIQTLKNKSWRFKTTTSLDDVLCLTVLKARSDIDNFAVETVTEAREQWLEPFEGDCKQCPNTEFCMAYIIGEEEEEEC